MRCLMFLANVGSNYCSLRNFLCPFKDTYRHWFGISPNRTCESLLRGWLLLSQPSKKNHRFVKNVNPVFDNTQNRKDGLHFKKKIKNGTLSSRNGAGGWTRTNEALSSGGFTVRSNCHYATPALKWGFFTPKPLNGPCLKVAPKRLHH